MFSLKVKTLAGTAALALALLGAAGDASAAADGNSATLEKSCVGVINSFQAAELGLTPVDTADLYFGGSVQAYQEMQRSCRDGGPG